MPQRATKTSFKKGESGNPAGRPVGALSIAKRTVTEIAEAVVFRVEFQNKLIELADSGKLAPAVMIELLHYSGGKPPTTIRREVPRSVAEERHAQAIRLLPQEKRYALADLLLEVERLQRSLPAKVIDAEAERVKVKAKR